LELAPPETSADNPPPSASNYTIHCDEHHISTHRLLKSATTWHLDDHGLLLRLPALSITRLISEHGILSDRAWSLKRAYQTTPFQLDRGLRPRICLNPSKPPQYMILGAEMESIHGIDVSWIHNTHNKGERKF